jgi:hypothetical protein
MSPELLLKINQGLDVILNCPSNIDTMGRIMTSDNAGIIPSRSPLAYSRFANDDEVIL